MTLSLGPIGEIYVESGASYEELALIIEEATGLASDRILAWKALSNYVSIDILLDCEWAELKYIGKKVR